MDGLRTLWLIISLIGIWGSARGVERWKLRLQARMEDGINGNRLYLARGRLLVWRVHFAAWALWLVSGVWVVMQGAVVQLPGDDRPLSEGIVGALIIGFALQAVILLVRNVQDEHIEKSIT